MMPMPHKGLVVGGPWDGRIVECEDSRLHVHVPTRLPPLGRDLAFVVDASPIKFHVFTYFWTPGVRLNSTAFTIGFWIPDEPGASAVSALDEIILHYHRSKTNPERKEHP